MTKLKSIHGYCLKSQWAHEVAALPYDILSVQEAWREIQDHPYSFLAIDQPEVYGVLFKAQGYNIVGKQLESYLDKGFYEPVEQALYVYELVYGTVHQVGIMGLFSTADYQAGSIKKHEATKCDKEEDRIKHLLSCMAHTGPALLMADYFTDNLNSKIQEVLNNNEPIISETYTDGSTHRLYAILDAQQIDLWCQEFKKIKELYIADGHHRTAAAVKLAQLYPEAEEMSYFLGAVFPKNMLKILAYHRVFKPDAFIEEAYLLRALKKHFQIEPIKKLLYLPTEKHVFGMCLGGKWYVLTYKSREPENLLECLDVSILQNYILAPLLGVIEPRLDERLTFIPDNKRSELYKAAMKDQSLVFTLYHTQIEDLMQIADIGEVMPPKSTWFEPKLRSGFVLHPFHF